MNKVIMLICIICACTSFSKAGTQQKKQPPPPMAAKPAVPVGRPPMPYVLKKDYEPQQQEMHAKINNAIGIASAARREISEGFGRVTILDTQMQQVQAILNSANFQIALTSDSLKETRFSMEEFRKQTEVNMAELRTANSELMKYLYILFGVAVALIIVVMFIMNFRINKLNSTIRNSGEEIKMNVKDEMQNFKTALQKEVKDEVQSVKGRVQLDMMTLKKDIINETHKDHDGLNSQISMIRNKLGMGEEPSGVEE